MPVSLPEFVRSIDVDSIMRLFSTPPRLLAVGEPTHGAEPVLDFRNRIFRQLVEHEHYKIIALESDCARGLMVEDFVTAGIGSLDDVMKNGFSHEWGRLEGNRDLVQWMREFNVGRTRSEMVRFAGFDGPLEISAAASPRRALVALHTYLSHWVDADLMPITAETLDRIIGDDAQWTDPQAMMDPSKSVGRSVEAVDLRLLADDLVAVLDTQAPGLVASTSRGDWIRARMHGRTATGLLRYHYWMADDSAARMARLCGLRDSMMATNILALTEQAPTLAYGHNSHLQRQHSRMQMWQGPIEWWSAGAHVSNELDDDYAFLPIALGTIEHLEVGIPAPATIEGLLYALPGNEFVVDTHSPATFDVQPVARVSPSFRYAPFDPTHLACGDGLLFVKDV